MLIDQTGYLKNSSNLKIDDKVLLRNIKRQKGDPVFDASATVVSRENFDSHLVRTDKGSFAKRHVDDLKLAPSPSTRVSARSKKS